MSIPQPNSHPPVQAASKTGNAALTEPHIQPQSQRESIETVRRSPVAATLRRCNNEGAVIYTRRLSVEQARSQYLRKLEEMKQVSSQSELQGATEELKQARSALQFAQRTSRLRKAGPKVPNRRTDWNAEPS